MGAFIFALNEVVYMKLSTQLDKGNKKNTKKKKRNNERFSEKELQELMGMNRDRYERRGGAVRRK